MILATFLSAVLGKLNDVVLSFIFNYLVALWRAKETAARISGFKNSLDELHQILRDNNPTPESKKWHEEVEDLTYDIRNLLDDYETMQSLHMEHSRISVLPIYLKLNYKVFEKANTITIRLEELNKRKNELSLLIAPTSLRSRPPEGFRWPEPSNFSSVQSVNWSNSSFNYSLDQSVNCSKFSSYHFTSCPNDSKQRFDSNECRAMFPCRPEKDLAICKIKDRSDRDESRVQEQETTMLEQEFWQVSQELRRNISNISNEIDMFINSWIEATPESFYSRADDGLPGEADNEMDSRESHTLWLLPDETHPGMHSGERHTPWLHTGLEKAHTP